jgi:hypothetical protein
MNDRARRAALLLPLVFLAGCGGSSTTSSAGSAATTPTASADATPSTAVLPSPGASAVSASVAPSAGGTSGRPQPSAQSAAPTPRSTKLDLLDAKLSATCVTPGGSLTLTLHARPTMAVVFDTRYPDGKDGQVHGGFEQNGRTDANGDYSKTWTVDPLTPTGDADTQVAAVDQQGQSMRKLPFRVARTC